jgi:CheY-like chemotaxis protein
MASSEKGGKEVKMDPRARLNDLHLSGQVEHAEGILSPEEANPRRLLVVDDDPGVQELLHEVLSGAGYRVETACNSDEAMERIAEENFDGLVVDLVLPEEDGLLLYDRVLQLNPYFRDRVVFISGEAREHQLRRVTRRTGAMVLRKPFNILDLMRVLKERGL